MPPPPLPPITATHSDNLSNDKSILLPPPKASSEGHRVVPPPPTQSASSKAKQTAAPPPPISRSGSSPSGFQQLSSSGRTIPLPPPSGTAQSPTLLQPAQPENAIDLSTAKQRRKFEYDIPEPANFRTLSEKEKKHFYQRRLKNLLEVKEDLLHEITKIDLLTKTINEDIEKLKSKSKDKKSKDKDKDKDSKSKDSKQKDKKQKDERHKKGDKKKIERGHPLFGAPLENIIEDGGLDFIRACVSFISQDDVLNSEGIFRVSVGSQRLDELQRRVEEYGNEAIESVDARTDPFLVPCLLKKYFREMKEPLFTFDCYTCFISASGVEDQNLRMKKYRDVVSMFLPESNKLVLKELFDFLYIVAQHSEKNKMSYGNLGTCFGPALLRDSQDFDPMNESLIISQIISDIIENKDYIFSPVTEE